MSTLSYQSLIREFDWGTPDRFNFASDVVDRWAVERDDTALVWANDRGDERQFSYSEMSGLTCRFANLLRDRGIGKGDRVLVMLPRIPEWPIAMVGAMRIGAVPIPCIEMLTARDLAYRLDHSGAKAIVCRAGQTGKFLGIADGISAKIALGGGSGWVDWNSTMPTMSDTAEPANVEADAPAIMYYTSGSTGEPKGVLHAARAIHAWRVSAVHWLDLWPGERIWCTADTGWSKAGTSILFGPWSCGATSFLYDGPFDAEERLRLLARHGITVYCAPGTELYRIVNVDFGAHDLSALRRTVSAGEAMNPAVAEKWRDLTGLTVSEAYGQTETLMTVLNIPGEPVKFGSMGLPSPGSEVDVIDEAGQRLPVGVEGDLAVMTPNPQMMLGYWKDPARTESLYLDTPDGRWFVTGDRAIKDDDGYFWYQGRSDDIINSAGYRIGPLEVENALLEHPAVQECAVVGSPDPERGEVVKAFVVLKTDVVANDALVGALKDHVKSLTAPYKYPRRIEFVDALPKTLTGKTKRRALRDRERAKGET